MKTNNMKQLPTAEELLKSNHLLIENDKTCEVHTHLVVKQMIEFAKLHVKAALESAYNNIEYTTVDSSVPYVVEESILNAYPLENIK